MRLHDQHCHTEYSLDSKASFKKYFTTAKNNQCLYFVTTEHIEFDSVYNRSNWTVDFDKMIKEMSNLSNSSIKCLLGIEIGYRKDKIKEMNDILEQYPFDLVNMSVHDNGQVDYYLKKDYEEIGITKMLDIYFLNVIDAITNFDNFDVLSHLDYGFKTAYLLDNTIDLKNYEHYLKEIFKIIINKNKVIEVNYKVQKNLRTTVFLEYWLDLYYQMGGRKISLSSDSHDSESYEEYYKIQGDFFNLLKKHKFEKISYFVCRKEYFISI